MNKRNPLRIIIPIILFFFTLGLYIYTDATATIENYKLLFTLNAITFPIGFISFASLFLPTKLADLKKIQFLLPFLFVSLISLGFVVFFTIDSIQAVVSPLKVLSGKCYIVYERTSNNSNSAYVAYFPDKKSNQPSYNIMGLDVIIGRSEYSMRVGKFHNQMTSTTPAERGGYECNGQYEVKSVNSYLGRDEAIEIRKLD